MSEEVNEGRDAATDRLRAAHREAVESVLAARLLHDRTCASSGAGSWPAIQAHDYLTREIDHQQQVREQYDLILDRRSNC